MEEVCRQFVSLRDDVAADVQNYKGTQLRYHNLYCSVLGTGSHRQSPEIE
jgi:hypothetical protein